MESERLLICRLFRCGDRLVKGATRPHMRLQKIPSYKFLSLAYQLASRLGAAGSDAGLQAPLQQLLVRLGREHPHHVLLCLLSLQSPGQEAAQGDKASAAAAVLSVRFGVHWGRS